MTQPPLPITRELAAWAVSARYADFAPHVQAEGARAFLNWLGCVMGGCNDPAVAIAIATASDEGGHPHASVIGHPLRTGVAQAAFINCLSSTVMSFDDTHLATVTHPTRPVAAAIFAQAERQPVTGEDFITALVVGMEVECRLSNLLLMPPARAEIGWFITGITGPVGAAAAMARLMRLDEQKTRAAIGLAVQQASGTRVAHGSQTAFVVPAHAARSGVSAGQLAARGITCTDQALEGGKGFVDVFGKGGGLRRAVDGLGTHFEFLSNAYKPYPSGIVVHPATDACLDLALKLPQSADTPEAFGAVQLRVNPLALDLCGRREPVNPVEAQLSVYHWAAATLLKRYAGINVLAQSWIDDAGIAALRARITAVADPQLARDEAMAEVTLADGTALRAHVEHARGSLARPMTDAELDDKFRDQAGPLVPGQACERLLHACRGVAGLPDVGKGIAALWAV